MELSKVKLKRNQSVRVSPVGLVGEGQRPETLQENLSPRQAPSGSTAPSRRQHPPQRDLTGHCGRERARKAPIPRPFSHILAAFPTRSPVLSCWFRHLFKSSVRSFMPPCWNGIPIMWGYRLPYTISAEP